MLDRDMISYFFFSNPISPQLFFFLFRSVMVRVIVNINPVTIIIKIQPQRKLKIFAFSKMLKQPNLWRHLNCLTLNNYLHLCEKTHANFQQRANICLLRNTLRLKTIFLFKIKLIIGGTKFQWLLSLDFKNFNSSSYFDNPK